MDIQNDGSIDMYDGLLRVGTASLAYPPTITKVGALGNGAVYDSLYNIPVGNNVASILASVGSPAYPTAAARQNIGATFTVQKNGYYMVSFGIGYDINPSGVVAGPTDNVTVGIYNNDTANLAVLHYFFPVPMPNTGNDYGQTATVPVYLIAGSTYQCQWGVNDNSGTLVLGASNSGINIDVIGMAG
jgi:hypothetical protein